MEDKRRFSFFQHRACEFFPCHRGVAEDAFNCLFCYCPLYALGKRCGGNYRYTDAGIKDCSQCAFPHRKENYDRVLARYGDILALVRETDGHPGSHDAPHAVDAGEQAGDARQP
ncbi:MAG: cysteine-rich small domain-containing protein [Aristaeellaceae bacterium]